MTREETLKHFKTWCQQTLGNNCSDKDLHMANNIIALLEQEPCEDAISRQAAKKTLEDRFIELQKRHSDNRYETNFCLNTILELPSVTPQHSDAEIQKIQEMEQAEIQKAYELGKAEMQPCGDAISRQAVLDAMYDLCDTGETLKENPWRDNPHIDAIIETIDDLPSVTPQQKMGQWVKTISENGITSAVRCSECGFEDNRYMLFRYCPNCGAKMEVAE